MSGWSSENLNAFVMAAFAGRREEVRRYLGDGMDPNCVHDDTKYALQNAVLGRQPTIVSDLLKAGACPNGPHAHLDPPLFFAAASGQLEVMRLLIAAGADVHRVDRNGRTALWYASSHGQDEAETLLRQEGLDYAVREMPAKEIAARRRGLQNAVAKSLRDVNTTDRETLALKLQDAINMDLPKEALRLLEQGAPPDFRERSEFPTALAWAAWNGYEDVVQAALQQEADVNLALYYEDVSTRGTPLVFAAIKGHARIARLLVEETADVNQEGFDEHCQGPALLFAGYYGHKKVFQYLKPLTDDLLVAETETFLLREKGWSHPE